MDGWMDERMDGWMDGVSERLSPRRPAGSRTQTQLLHSLTFFGHIWPRSDMTQSALQRCLDDLNQTWGTVMSCKASKEEDPIPPFSCTIPHVRERERAGCGMDGADGRELREEVKRV